MLFPASGARFLRNVYLASLKNGSQEMFETIAVPATHPPTNDKIGKDHERTQHHPRALMRLAVPMPIVTVLIVHRMRVATHA